MLEITDLVAGYGPLEVLRGVSLSVEPGQVVVVMGPNGAGKTTLLRAIMGIAQVQKGTIDYQGRNIIGMPIEKHVDQGLSMVAEGRHLFPRMSVLENLELGALKLGGKDTKASRIAFVLDLFPALRTRLSQLAGSMSGGEQQMLAIGRALMSKPQLLLLDEPSLGLAPRITAQVFDAVARLKQEGETVLLVEQRVAEALSVADKAYVLESGQIVDSGPAGEISNRERLQRSYFSTELILDEDVSIL
jgi:branched-chain amino acid transport system ATP-binding protein